MMCALGSGAYLSRRMRVPMHGHTSGMLSRKRAEHRSLALELRPPGGLGSPGRPAGRRGGGKLSITMVLNLNNLIMILVGSRVELGLLMRRLSRPRSFPITGRPRHASAGAKRRCEQRRAFRTNLIRRAYYPKDRADILG